MLVRDRVGKELIKAIEKVKDAEVEVVQLRDNEEFLEAIFLKIKSEIDNLQATKSVSALAEIVELIDWIQVCFGTTSLDVLIEERKDKLGLYWERFYIKEKDKQEK